VFLFCEESSGVERTDPVLLLFAVHFPLHFLCSCVVSGEFVLVFVFVCVSVCLCGVF